VFRNGRTDGLTLASKNNKFGWLLLCHNLELALRCATIAYQLYRQPEGV